VIGIDSKTCRGSKIILGVGLFAAYCLAALAADTITGVVRNQTRAQPAAGDEVILLRLDQAGLDQARPNHGTQEEARTTTDSQGSFTLAMRFSARVHLLRVIHQGVNYDHQISAGDVVSIDVFDAAAKVGGIAGSIEIIRTGTNGNLLHVSDMVEIRNDSRPPLTQVGERTFEVYLPARAKIDSVLAAGPGTIGMMISAASVASEPGHFTVNFPLRPGATKFAFNYDVPYAGHAVFHPRLTYPVQQLAVMIPPTMKFTSRSTAFQLLPTGNDRYQVEAANQVGAGDGPGFEISGVGPVPALRPRAFSPPKAKVPAILTPGLSSQGSSAAQSQSSTALRAVPASGMSGSSYRLHLPIVVLVAFVLLAVCGFLFWRRQRLSANTAGEAPLRTEQRGQSSGSPLEVLKEELSQLEAERLHGLLSGDEYVSTKEALEGTLKRVLARSGG